MLSNTIPNSASYVYTITVDTSTLINYFRDNPIENKEDAMGGSVLTMEAELFTISCRCFV
jgi:hypothetical protein